METSTLFGYLSGHGIDTNRFDHIHDRDIESRYPAIKNWIFDGDPRHDWLKQQALKLSCLDYLDYEVALIHDPDTWITRPYRCYDGDIRLMALADTTEGSYDQVLPSVLGIKRQSAHCFVTEFMPVIRQDWLDLKHTLEHRHGKHFLDSIIDPIPTMPTLDGKHDLKWFAEYELLGNWTMTRRRVDLWYQSRFEFRNLHDLDHYDPARYNAMCDQSPGHEPMLKFDDWHTGSIENFGAVVEILSRYHDI